jgi:IS30 family transposase
VADRPCVETIYTSVYAGVLDLKASQCLRTRRPRRRHRQDRHPNKRAGLPNIATRPAVVNDRGQIGDWEADQIIGRGNQSSMITLTERVTKYQYTVTLRCGYAAVETLAGLVHAFEQIPAHLRRSVTFDQGSEWAEWETLTATYNLDVYFCDPHSPWQRGQIGSSGSRRVGFRWMGRRADGGAQLTKSSSGP